MAAAAAAAAAERGAELLLREGGVCGKWKSTCHKNGVEVSPGVCGPVCASLMMM